MMNDMAVITAFLGWCTVINFGVLAFATLMLSVAGDWAKKIHSAVSHVPVNQLDSKYFTFLGNYKLAILVLNLVPYLALKIIS